MTTDNSKKTVKGKPFKPGQSGNPGGRPKTLQEVKDAFRLHTVTALNTLVSIVEHSEKDSDRVRAAECILNRAWGTPEQSVAVSGSMASMAIDTSKLDTKSQDALLNAVVGIYGAQNTDDEETTDTD